jgi:hypothetical protein
MRQIVDAGCATTGPRQCRPFQNVDMLPSREEIAKQNKAKLYFAEGWIAERLKRDLELRHEKLEYPDLYAYSGFVTPALAGCSEHDVDFESILVDRR